MYILSSNICYLGIPNSLNSTRNRKNIFQCCLSFKRQVADLHVQFENHHKVCIDFSVEFVLNIVPLIHVLHLFFECALIFIVGLGNRRNRAGNLDHTMYCTKPSVNLIILLFFNINIRPQTTSQLSFYQWIPFAYYNMKR